ncbi:MAG TPA: tail fiber domain-containing protein [Candidatus Udaeobacter sp.]
MNPLIQLKTTPPFLITVALLCFGLLPGAQAVVPPPDGGYPGFNTAEGQNALFSLTTGTGNTAVGWFSLFSNTEGSFNTAVGAGALLLNIGNAFDGVENTAVGTGALLFNTSGASNTAIGSRALFNNTIGLNNTAIGAFALFSNTTGTFNTANGIGALDSNTTGNVNTAIGGGALGSNTTGHYNTALGADAGFNITGDRNICIGNGVSGVAGEDDTIRIGTNLPAGPGDSACYIGGIYNQFSSNGVPVLINNSFKLGTSTSSKRFKEEIKPMNEASEAIFSLKPVTFRYKKKIDPAGTSQFGLVAEEVEKINPDLIVRDKEGKPNSVRYDQVNAMLLNEFLKEHRKGEEQDLAISHLKSALTQQEKRFESKLAEQEQQIAALTVDLQRLTADIELNKAEARALAEK